MFQGLFKNTVNGYIFIYLKKMFITRGQGIFLFTTASRTAVGPTQPPIQWVTGVLSLGIKWPGREADHSLPSNAELKNVWSYTSTPQHLFVAWCFVKYRDSFKHRCSLYLSCKIQKKIICTKIINYVYVICTLTLY
jgi:hypothetical protein